MSYSLIIPIYNEDQTLKSLLDQLKNIDEKIEVIIVNDGSTDKTKNILDQHCNLNTIHIPINGGKGAAITLGVRQSNNENLILIDGDLEIDLSCINSLIREFELLNYSIISGNRWKNYFQKANDIHTFGNFFFNKLFNFLYNTKFKDILCCVKIIKKSVFNSLRISSRGFSIEAEIMSKLAKKKIKVIEKDIPYNRRKRSQGKKIKITDGWGILWEMIKIRFL